MEEYITFGVYVKRNIMDEANDYRCEFDFMYSNVALSCTDSITEYFTKHPDMLSRLNVDGKYDVYADLNAHKGFCDTMRLVTVLTDEDVKSSSPPYGSNKTCPHLQVVPEEEIWYKYVLLDEEEIAAAKKMLDEIEKVPFKRRKMNK
jgi:hypothetical protein